MRRSRIFSVVSGLAISVALVGTSVAPAYAAGSQGSPFTCSTGRTLGTTIKTSNYRWLKHTATNGAYRTWDTDSGIWITQDYKNWGYTAGRWDVTYTYDPNVLSNVCTS